MVLVDGAVDSHARQSACFSSAFTHRTEVEAEGVEPSKILLAQALVFTIRWLRPAWYAPGSICSRPPWQRRGSQPWRPWSVRHQALTSLSRQRRNLPKHSVTITGDVARFAVEHDDRAIELIVAGRDGDRLIWNEVSADGLDGDMLFHARSTFAVALAARGWPLLRAGDDLDEVAI